DLRSQSEAAILACVTDTGSDTLSRHYVETMRWYFERPRFVLPHLVGSGAAEAWWLRQCDTVARYLSEGEMAHLEQLRRLGLRKTRIDFHHAAQGLMKRWLLVHIPLSTATLTLAVWHVLVVHVYAA